MFQVVPSLVFQLAQPHAPGLWEYIGRVASLLQSLASVAR